MNQGRKPPSGLLTGKGPDQMQKRKKTEDALTVLGVILLILGFVLLGYIALGFISHSPGSTSPGGLLHTFASDSGNLLRHVGPVTVFSAVDGTPSDVAVRYPHPDPGSMGAAEMNVALFIGSMGGVDFDKVRVVWISGGIAETIPRKDSRPLACPGWTIAGKYNMLSAKSGNGDDILDPNEQFEIFVCPTNVTSPYQQFSLIIAPPGNVLPPIISTTAPPMVKPLITLI